MSVVILSQVSLRSKSHSLLLIGLVKWNISPVFITGLRVPYPTVKMKGESYLLKPNYKPVNARNGFKSHSLHCIHGYWHRVFKLKIENSLVNAHTITSTTAVTINNENQNQIVEAEKFNLLQLMRKWSNNQLFLNYKTNWIYSLEFHLY